MIRAAHEWIWSKSSKNQVSSPRIYIYLPSVAIIFLNDILKIFTYTLHSMSEYKAREEAIEEETNEERENSTIARGRRRGRKLKRKNVAVKVSSPCCHLSTRKTVESYAKDARRITNEEAGTIATGHFLAQHLRVSRALGQRRAILQQSSLSTPTELSLPVLQFPRGDSWNGYLFS